MNRFSMVLTSAFTASFVAGAAVSSQLAQAEQAPTVKLDLTQAIKKSLTTRRLGYARPVRGQASIVANLKADLVTVNFGLKATGGTAGETISALSGKKDELIAAAKAAGTETVEASTTAINVRARSMRRYSADGSQTRKDVFNGTLSVLITFKAGDDVLATIGKIASDKVSSVGQMQFSFSDEGWANQSKDLKQKAFDKARDNAVEQARRQGREITTVSRSHVNDPRRPSRYRQRTVPVNIMATVSYNTQ